MIAAGFLLIAMVATSVQPATAAGGAPTITFQAPSTGDFSATLTSTVNRGERQIATINCALTPEGGVTSSASCGGLTATSTKGTTRQVSLSNLDAGDYAYTVTVTMTDGKRTSATTLFTINQRSQTITFGAGSADLVVGGSYTPSATATSGLPVTFSINNAAISRCSLTGGVVHFDAAGVCTVDGNQTGNTSWAPAPLVQQTFTITAPAPPPLTLTPKIDVNKDDDPQSPPVPPNPEANRCPPQSILGGGCNINPLDGSVDNFFDASASFVGTTDPSRDTITYHWEIFKPPGLSGAPYSSSGITGYRSAVLQIRPSSLPTLTGSEAGQDIFWRVRLTLTLNDKTTVSWFRFDYQQSTLTLQMSTDCQRIGQLQGDECTIEAINGLPPTEPT